METAVIKLCSKHLWAQSTHQLCGFFSDHNSTGSLVAKHTRTSVHILIYKVGFNASAFHTSPPPAVGPGGLCLATGFSFREDIYSGSEQKQRPRSVVWSVAGEDPVRQRSEKRHTQGGKSPRPHLPRPNLRSSSPLYTCTADLPVLSPVHAPKHPLLPPTTPPPFGPMYQWLPALITTLCGQEPFYTDYMLIDVTPFYENHKTDE
jgi:hypothetical protein